MFTQTFIDTRLLFFILKFGRSRGTFRHMGSTKFEIPPKESSGNLHAEFNLNLSKGNQLKTGKHGISKKIPAWSNLVFYKKRNCLSKLNSVNTL